jgi:multisubunit Na+/H+ antiporter MnhB subunit
MPAVAARKCVGVPVARRPVAAVAAVLLFMEAIGIVLFHLILGTAVDRQRMSLAGLDPDMLSVSAWLAGGVFGLYLALCGAVLLRAAVWDRPPGRFARVALIGCAVVHGVLGALTVGLVGWNAFVFLMVVLGLIVLALIAYDAPGAGVDRPGGAGGPPAPDGPPPAEPGVNPA